uniref:Uncharacterized protein n=1 Tax=Setaria viridis TaxID=4556 RepID=A0A4U6UJY7_SETVI|nr:hypothetical protein SEVIR_5G234150v2 [Setaria viridis]
MVYVQHGVVAGALNHAGSFDKRRHRHRHRSPCIPCHSACPSPPLRIVLPSASTCHEEPGSGSRLPSTKHCPPRGWSIRSSRRRSVAANGSLCALAINS